MQYAVLWWGNVIVSRGVLISTNTLKQALLLPPLRRRYQSSITQSLIEGHRQQRRLSYRTYGICHTGVVSKGIKMNDNNTYMSASERKALAHFATLPMNIVPMQNFYPRLPTSYRDGAGDELTGKPDALAKQRRSFTFIESKAGILNDHRSRASCHRALQAEFNYTMESDEPKSYVLLTKHFKHNNFPFMLANSWNQSLYKVLALQRLHGWERFLVVFANNPHARDAERYQKAGLVFATHETLAQMLAVIKLATHGLYYPFCLDARRSGYYITMEPSPNPAHLGLAPEQIAADNRASFEEVVAAAAAAEESAKAERAAEIAEYVARRTAAAAIPAAPARVAPAKPAKRSRA
jgi:hypothetical protein